MASKMVRRKSHLVDNLSPTILLKEDGSVISCNINIFLQNALKDLLSQAKAVYRGAQAAGKPIFILKDIKRDCEELLAKLDVLVKSTDEPSSSSVPAMDKKAKRKSFSGTDEQFEEFVRPFILACKTKDSGLVMVALDGLEMLIQYAASNHLSLVNDLLCVVADCLEYSIRSSGPYGQVFETLHLRILKTLLHGVKEWQQPFHQEAVFRVTRASYQIYMRATSADSQSHTMECIRYMLQLLFERFRPVYADLVPKGYRHSVLTSANGELLNANKARTRSVTSLSAAAAQAGGLPVAPSSANLPSSGVPIPNPSPSPSAATVSRWVSYSPKSCDRPHSALGLPHVDVPHGGFGQNLTAPGAGAAMVRASSSPADAASGRGSRSGGLASSVSEGPSGSMTASHAGKTNAGSVDSRVRPPALSPFAGTALEPAETPPSPVVIMRNKSKAPSDVQMLRLPTIRVEHAEGSSRAPAMPLLGDALSDGLEDSIPDDSVSVMDDDDEGLECCHVILDALIDEVVFKHELEPLLESMVATPTTLDDFRPPRALLEWCEGDGYHENVVTVVYSCCRMCAKTMSSERMPPNYCLRRKLLSFELLLYMLMIFEPHITSSQPLRFLMRRVCCQILGRNCCDNSPMVYRSVFNIFGTFLERGYKYWLKVEIGLVLQSIFLRLLESSHTTLERKVYMLREIIRIARMPQALADIFLNYDLDHNNSVDIFERMVGVLTSIALCDTDRKGGGDASDVRTAAVEAMCEISKSMQCWNTTQELLPRDRRATTLCYQSPNRAEDFPLSSPENSYPTLVLDDDEKVAASTGDVTGRKFSFNMYSMPTRQESLEIETFEAKKKSRGLLEKGITIFNVESGKKGLRFLREAGLVGDSPSEVARFLHSTAGLDKTKIGEYLGEGDPFYINVMHAYVEGIDLTGQNFVDALRHFLSGFRLPGEAQKIDRMMEAFAARFCSCNPGSNLTEDVAYILAYATIMLNTDAHNTMVRKKMTLEEFISNNRGINDGQDLDRNLLESIYTEIKTNEIKMKDDHETYESKFGAGGVQLLSRDEIFNKEVHEILSSIKRKSKEAAWTTSSARQASGLRLARLMFELSWSNMHAVFSTTMDAVQDARRIVMSLEGVSSCIHVASFHWMTVERNAFVSALAKFIYLSDEWHKNHRGTTSSRKTSMMGAIKDKEVLRTLVTGSYLQLPWVQAIQQCKSPDDTSVERLNAALHAVCEVTDKYITKVEAEDSEIKISSLAKNFLGLEENLLQSDRRLMLQGPLTKICRKKHKKFYFFLFNDILLYAKLVSGKYSVHRKFDLNDITINEVPDHGTITNAFQLNHPKKSFTVYAATPEEKTRWLEQFVSALAHTGNTGDGLEAAPVWMPDTDSDRCANCLSPFTLVRRRHHCRNCGQLVCGKCSQRRCTIARIKKKKEVRVCDECAEALTKGH